MKKIPIYLTALVLITFCYCEPELHYTAGFDSPIKKNSSGLVVVHVSNKASSLVLEGVIQLLEGQVEIKLLDPADRIAYSYTCQVPNPLAVNETFNIIPGYWTLTYKSLKGNGSINLHLHYE